MVLSKTGRLLQWQNTSLERVEVGELDISVIQLTISKADELVDINLTTFQQSANNGMKLFMKHIYFYTAFLFQELYSVV